MSRPTLSIAALAVVAAVAIGACSGAGAAAPSPSDAPSPVPTAAPTDRPVPTPVVTPEPTDRPTDAMPIKVDLDNATGHDVYVDVADRSGDLVGAESGHPGDGVTVDVYDIRVENVDDRTLRLTWSDTPGDNALALLIDESASTLILVQPEKAGPTDAMAFDRILVLEFDRPISAADIHVSLQDGLDT